MPDDRRVAAPPVTATYRLQLRNGVDLHRAAEAAGYIADLGASHVYVSPVFAAAPGSAHGYDVVDPNRIDPALGGEPAFDRFSDALARRGLGLILDIVPNHMAAHPANPWWRDVLAWGADSLHARFFDIDWSAPRLLLPLLPEPYVAALAAGAFEVAREGGTLVMAVGDLRLPLAPHSWPMVLETLPDAALSALARRAAAATPDDESLPQHVLGIAAAVDGAVAQANADPALRHRVHEAQVWRLAHWRLAREALTYRRFFEIDGLVGVQVERRDVFEATHRLIFRLVDEGRVQGLRVDHVDGLADPRRYLRRLADRVGERATLWVEKILQPGERLPDWPVAGETGYAFAQTMAELMVDPDGEAALTAGYAAFTGEDASFEAMADAAKRRILTANLAAELDRLTGMALELARGSLESRDFGRDTLRRTIVAFVQAMPVYRTYVDADGCGAQDAALLDRIADAVRAGGAVEDENAVAFISGLMRGEPAAPGDRARALAFARRVQQTTGPVMAKALEDTLFFRYNRLTGLNEVGGAPERFGASIDHAHGALARTSAEAMTALTTHDTKRGEDARARLYAISLAPDRWSACVAAWRGALPAAEDMTPGDQWLFFQTLLAVWPGGDDAPLADRMAAFMIKAAREAKLRTTWTLPDAEYERRLEDAVRAALDLRSGAAFRAAFAEGIAPFVEAGRVIALAQTAVRLVAPGAPDIYNGAEASALTLVDPDNRRPVDFDLLARRLAALSARGIWGGTASTGDDEKLALTATMLRLRRAAPRLFLDGAYTALSVAPEGGAFAFARTLGDAAIIVAAPIRQAVARLSGLDPAPPMDSVMISGVQASGPLRDVMTGATLVCEEGRLALPAGTAPRLLARGLDTALASARGVANHENVSGELV